LTTSDIKEHAVQTCDALLQQVKTTPLKVKEAWRGQAEYARKEKINHLVEMVFLCCGQLHEFERGVQYFMHNYVEKTPEVKLYILLRFVFSFQQKDLFVQEYQKAIESGIQPREKLVNIYDTIQRTGELPEQFY